MLTHLFPFESFYQIKEYVLAYMTRFNSESFYLKSLDVSDNLKTLINDELFSYNLPEISNFLIFKRRGYYSPNIASVHIDYSSALDQFINCSVVFPIEGCDNTFMFWMEGDYYTETIMLPDNISAKMIKWKSTPKISHTETITEPTLCKVNIPHDACSKINGEFRTTATMRLKGNPTLEQIVKLRFGNEK